jgi:hypothetical protein
MSSLPHSERRKLEPPRQELRQSQQPKRTERDDADQPEDSRPPVRRSSNPDGRPQATSPDDGVNILNNPPPRAGSTNSGNRRSPQRRPGDPRDIEGGSTNSGNRRSPQRRPGDPRDTEGGQRARDDSPERLERTRNQDNARNGGQRTKSAQQLPKHNLDSRSNPPQPGAAPQASGMRRDGRGTGMNNPQAGKCEGKGCPHERQLSEIRRILAKPLQEGNAKLSDKIPGQEALRDDSYPHQQAGSVTIKQREARPNLRRERGAERESSQEHDYDLAAGNPLAHQERGPKQAVHSGVRAKGSPLKPSSERPDLQAAKMAMGEHATEKRIAPKRQQRMGDNDSSPPSTRRPAVDSNPGAPPYGSADRKI